MPGVTMPLPRSIACTHVNAWTRSRKSLCEVIMECVSASGRARSPVTPRLDAQGHQLRSTIIGGGCSFQFGSLINPALDTALE